MTEPAINLEKIKHEAPGLVDMYETAAVSLHKQGLTGVRAAVYLVLDYSLSMSDYYRNGTIQGFTDRVLALSAHFDNDGKVPVILFDHAARPAITVDLADHRGAVQRIVGRAGDMGNTDYTVAMQAVVDHYTATTQDVPAVVIFQTDGATGHPEAVEQSLRDYSGLPILWSFVGYGDPKSREFDLLRKLDTLDGRWVDNASFFPAGIHPSSMSDAHLYDNLTAPLSPYLAAVRAANIWR